MPKTFTSLANWHLRNGIFFYCPNGKVIKAILLESNGNIVELYPWEYIDSWNVVSDVYPSESFFSRRYALDRVLGNKNLTCKLDIKTKTIVKML